MIFNLVAYLKAQLGTYTFIANGWRKDSPDESITVNDDGGTPDHYDFKVDLTVQIIARSRDSVTSRKYAEDTYNKLLNRFGLTLPEVTINLVTYSAVDTAQISPIQRPAFIGMDDEGRALYSFNIQITIGGN